jgi:ubiquinone/menaquinone biosynthesis C-methylase UbiE
MTIAKPTFFELFKQMMSSMEDGYDSLAPKFDQSEYVTPKNIINPVIDHIKNNRGPFERGIDVCCGTGAASSELVNLCDTGFTAFDLSQGMLDQCEKKIEHKKDDIQIQCIKGNALDLPFENEYDVAVSFGAFGHILEADKAIFVRNINKCLKKGGEFYFVTTFTPGFFRWLYWRQIFFNWSMHIRNFFFKPKFIMYYLTFRLPEVEDLLKSEGFKVDLYTDVFSNNVDQTPYLIPTNEFVLVKATKE